MGLIDFKEITKRIDSLQSFLFDQQQNQQSQQHFTNIIWFLQFKLVKINKNKPLNIIKGDEPVTLIKRRKFISLKDIEEDGIEEGESGYDDDNTNDNDNNNSQINTQNKLLFDENVILSEKLQTTFDKIQSTTNHINEISQLQSQLINQIQLQGEVINEVYF